MTDWIPTGSCVSGYGYRYELLRNGDAPDTRHHAVLLIIGGPFIDPTRRSAVVPAESPLEAERIGERFCHAWRQWQTVQRRERALSQGFAVLG